MKWKYHSQQSLFECRKEIHNYEKLNISFDNKEDFVERKYPKISVVVTVYNQENFLKYIYASILKQSLKDIEIIFVDDASTDNSSLIIKEFMKKDKRIVYVKNEVNKRAFYSRNRGVLCSRGEYILVIDCDDLLLNNILIKLYETAKEHNLDILQYYVISGSYKRNRLWSEAKYKNGIIYNNDEVMNIFYFSVTRNLWDKLIKRKVFIRSILFMPEEFHKETYVLHNDDTAFFGIIKMADSYGFLEEIGYFYNLYNSKSTRHFYFENKYMNNIFHSLFATMKYYYIKSDNNKLEKNNVAYKFFYKKIYKPYINNINSLTEGFDYIIDVLDLYLQCLYFNEEQKTNITIFKNKINERIISIKKYAIL